MARLNFSVTAAKTFTASAIISGPMPSPGMIRIFLLINLLSKHVVVEFKRLGPRLQITQYRSKARSADASFHKHESHRRPLRSDQYRPNHRASSAYGKHRCQN